MKIKEFLVNTAKGAGIGVAMIVPGVSGGTIAVMTGIYDKIIDSVGNITTRFKASILFLLPIFLGAVIALCAMYFPIKYALEYAPFPTITLFAGLMMGSLPDLFEAAKGNGFNKRFDIAALIIPFVVVIGVCFIPHLGEVNLGADMEVAAYYLVLLVGMLASCALVVPGISGSMLLLIFGYYQPILDTVSAITTTPGHSILILVVFAAGVIIGFFTIAKLMQLLLKKYRRTTFWAILGFVVGSIPAMIVIFYQQYGAEYLNALQISLGVVLFVGGAVASYFLTLLAKRIAKKRAANELLDGNGLKEES